MKRKHVVAILDTMWGGLEEAPPWFKINPNNHSGRRLYKIVGPDTFLLVTNACRECADNANGHGTPDPEWLAENLMKMNALRPIDVLLVCGKVAQGTYMRVFAKHGPLFQTRVIEMPHPAARSWTKNMIAEAAAKVQS